jgi:hypothetical protein
MEPAELDRRPDAARWSSDTVEIAGDGVDDDDEEDEDDEDEDEDEEDDDDDDGFGAAVHVTPYHAHGSTMLVADDDDDDADDGGDDDADDGGDGAADHDDKRLRGSSSFSLNRSNACTSSQLNVDCCAPALFAFGPIIIITVIITTVIIIRTIIFLPIAAIGLENSRARFNRSDPPDY